MSQTLTITHDEITSLRQMQQSPNKEDIQFMMGIIQGFCDRSDGTFIIHFNNNIYNINIQALDKKYHFNSLYSMICRIIKNKPQKYKEYIQREK